MKRKDKTNKTFLTQADTVRPNNLIKSGVNYITAPVKGQRDMEVLRKNKKVVK